MKSQNKTSNKMSYYIAEMLIVSGLFLIAFATYLISTIASIYVVALIFLLSGIFVAYTRGDKS
jgi:uncharacterized membrane protein